MYRQALEARGTAHRWLNAWLSAGVLVAVGAAMVLNGAAMPVPAALRQPTCGLVRPSAVASAYGITVRAPTAVVRPPMTVCTFTSNKPPVIVLVRFEVGQTAATFQAGRSQYAAHGRRTTTVPGFGEMAYASAIGSGKTLTSTLVVLKGSTALLVSGTGPLGKAESLARRLLPEL